MAIIELTAENFDTEVLQSEKPVLIDFWAVWCGPCKMLAPIVEDLADEREDIKVCKVNVDNCPELARKFQIASIPTLLFFKGGELVEKSIGLISEDELYELVGE